MQPFIPASKESKARFFQRLEWKTDRVLLDGLVFRLQHYRSDAWELGEECLVFYKTKPLVDQYARFLSTRLDFAPERIFELGMWDGGSIAFWFELFQPRKHVAIDLADREDSPYFGRYRASRGLADRIATHWRTNQADREGIRAIAAREFDGPLDLVIDDASHLYAATKASFEFLFPLIRPGGFYIIEDWAWAHWKEFKSPTHPWASEVPLTSLVCQLVEVAGSSPAVVGNVTVYEGFTVIERGPAKLEPQGFRIENHIQRREEPRMLMQARRRYWAMRKVAARVLFGRD